MSTKTHDELIEKAAYWAKSLGYTVIDKNPGTKTGADAIFQNHLGEKAIIEVVTRSDFKTLFEKPRVKPMLIPSPGTYVVSEKEFLGLIVVAPRINNVRKHAIKVGIPKDVLEGKNQKVFAVRECDFKQVIPVLLVSILGSRASAYGRAG